MTQGSLQYRISDYRTTIEVRRLRSISLCLLTIFLSLTFVVEFARAMPVVGSAATVVRDVQGITKSSIRTILIDDNVYEKEKIKTSSLSSTRIVFADQTDFMIGPNSEVVLDEFVYSSQPGQGKLLLRAVQGVMKFRTGAMASESYKIRSRVATIGVRGTEFSLHVLADGTTFVYVISGKVIVTDNKGRTTVVLASESAVVYPEDYDRAQNGPIHFSEVSPELVEEVRQLVSMIVYQETAFEAESGLQYLLPNPERLNDFQLAVIPDFAYGFNPGGPQQGQQGGDNEGGGGTQGGGGIAGGGGGGTGGGDGAPDSLTNPPADDPPPAGAGGAGSPVVSNDGFLINGDFESGKQNWIDGPGTGPSGTFDIIADDPDDPNTNHRALLTTGSPILIAAQLTSTPDNIFWIDFDVEFLDGPGVLEVLINGDTIATLVAAFVGPEGHVRIVVDDIVYGGLTDAELTFFFNAVEAGQRLTLDNIRITDSGEPFATGDNSPGGVPEPAILPILAVSSIALAIVTARRRRQR